MTSLSQSGMVLYRRDKMEPWRKVAWYYQDSFIINNNEFIEALNNAKVTVNNFTLLWEKLIFNSGGR